MLEARANVTKIYRIMTDIIAIGFCGYFALLILLFSVKNFVIKDETSFDLSE